MTARRPWHPLTERYFDDAFVHMIAEAWHVEDDVVRATCTIWRNDRYQVVKRVIAPDGERPPMAHLSIKRVDRNALLDWRHLQQIKNELVGEDCEAVQLFPAEDRLVDEANQFHLFAVTDPGFRFDFGSHERTVSSPEDAASVGAKQRSWEEGLTTGGHACACNPQGGSAGRCTNPQGGEWGSQAPCYRTRHEPDRALGVREAAE